jgi:hydrogenase small subunit
VGCKGPETFAPCPVVKWNDGTSFPIQSGHPCIGCTELHFFDRMTPFYRKLPNVPGLGVEATALKVGAIATGSALAAIAAHAIGSTIRFRDEAQREQAVTGLPIVAAPGTTPPASEQEEHKP